MLAAAQVIAAIATILTDAAGFEPGVFVGRGYPLSEADLPACRLYSADESIQVETVGYPARQTHLLQVDAELHVLNPDTAEADMHTHTAQLLAAQFASQATATLSPLRCTVSSLRIERQLAEEGEAAAARATVSLLVRFRTLSNDPETIV